MFRNGTVVEGNTTDRVIHEVGQSCKVPVHSIVPFILHKCTHHGTVVYMISILLHTSKFKSGIFISPSQGNLLMENPSSHIPRGKHLKIMPILTMYLHS